MPVRKFLRLLLLLLAISMFSLADDDDRSQGRSNYFLAVSDVAHDMYRGARQGLLQFGILLVFTTPYEILSGNYFLFVPDDTGIIGTILGDIADGYISYFLMQPVVYSFLAWVPLPHIDPDSIDAFFGINNYYNFLMFPLEMYSNFLPDEFTESIINDIPFAIPLAMMYGFANYMVPNQGWYLNSCQLCLSLNRSRRLRRGFVYVTSARVTISLLFFAQRFLFYRYCR